MSDLRSHGPSVNADVIDLAEERRRNALYVLGILLRAYVPKNTSDSRELDSALAALASPSLPAGQEVRTWNPEPPCWLVEKRAEGRTVAYLGHALGTSDWMPTPDKATRFVRREDANGVAECFEFEDVIVAEHIWG